MSDIINGQQAIETMIKDTEVRLKQQGYVVAYTEEELQKVAEMQQAAVEKAYEVGREDALSEITRCKDCKHYLYPLGCGHIDGMVTSHEDGFCSYAERREDGTHSTNTNQSTGRLD